MQVTTYLTFNGNCAEAMRYYAEHLGGTIEMMLSHGDAPIADQVPKEWHESIMHARLALGDGLLMASDAPPEHGQPPQGFSVSLGVVTPAEAERVFAALADGGTVRMPLQPTFWAERFGMVVDRFGIPWMVNCEGTRAGAVEDATRKPARAMK
jgi:PhnB protein